MMRNSSNKEKPEKKKKTLKEVLKDKEKQSRTKNNLDFATRNLSEEKQNLLSLET